MPHTSKGSSLDVYFSSLEVYVNRAYKIAEEARSKGLDASPKPEIEIANSLSKRVEMLVGPPGISAYIDRLLSKGLSKEEIAFELARYIVKNYMQKLGSKERVAEQALRTALAFLNEGKTAAAISGIDKVKIRKNFDGTEYLAVYFAGPMRSAGGTEQGLTVVIADYIRRLLNLDRYKPTEDDIRRYIEEIRVYETKVSRFQYHLTNDQIEIIVRNTPIEITGPATDDIPVPISSRRISAETSKVRGGALRVINDGLGGRCRKVLKALEKLSIKEHWMWLEQIKPIKQEEDNQAVLEDVVGGRPIFSMGPGGFRLRIGRSRHTGLAAVGLSPVTMALLKFIGIGTQLKLNMPGKAGIVLPVDSIEPPIVRLKDGSVVKLKTVQDVRRLQRSIDLILFLGDILVSLGDFVENNRPLPKLGYCEEWWAQELRAAVAGDQEKLQKVKKYIDDPFENVPSVEESINLSMELGIPLHPEYTFMWDLLLVDELVALREFLKTKSDWMGKDLVFPLNEKMKRLLEKACICHKVKGNKIVIEYPYSIALKVTLSLDEDISVDTKAMQDTISLINNWSKVPVRPKGGTFIQARMGRPEKAAPRKMKKIPINVLFPVGKGHEGASNVDRDLMNVVSRTDFIEVEIHGRVCPKCGKTFFTNSKCPDCGVETVPLRFCPRCGRKILGKKCIKCNVTAVTYSKQKINLKELLQEKLRQLPGFKPKSIRGVLALTSLERIPEPLEKGILRACFNVYVYKDGTSRFDCTNAPLTYFKPKEINVEPSKLRELGYTTDIYGRELVSDDQILELKPQDIVIPLEAAEYLFRCAQFIDALLTNFYKMPPFYKLKSPRDLIGHLVVGISPHTSVGVIGRIIGFTKAKVCFAHPFWHAAKRRDCDGDEDSIMLLMDALLNFSRKYLPRGRGGSMDAPLILSVTISPQEVDEQAYNIEIYDKPPLQIYSGDLSGVIFVKDLIEKGNCYSLSFSAPTSDIVYDEVRVSLYKESSPMSTKITMQLQLASKIACVDEHMVATKLIEKHLLRDIKGNLKAFFTQSFYCRRCRARYTIPPLNGKCKCGAPLSTTVKVKNITKYLHIVEDLYSKYKLPGYVKNEVALISSILRSFLPGEHQSNLLGKRSS